MSKHYHIVTTDFTTRQISAGPEIAKAVDAYKQMRELAAETRKTQNVFVKGTPKDGYVAKEKKRNAKTRPIITLKQCSGECELAKSAEGHEASEAPHAGNCASSSSAEVVNDQGHVVYETISDEEQVRKFIEIAEQQLALSALDQAWEDGEYAVRYARRVLLYGAPGTGKTTLGFRVGRALKKNVYSITCTPELSAAEIRGHWVPGPDGTFIWMDGPAIRAWREGAMLVINEIDKCGGDLEIFLYAVLDDPEIAFTTLPSGECVKPAPGFQCLATMNGQPDDLVEALQSRMPTRVEINTPHPGAIARLPEDLQNAARGTVSLTDPNERIDMRRWMEFASLREKMDQERAARLVFQHRAVEVVSSLIIAEAAD